MCKLTDCTFIIQNYTIRVYNTFPSLFHFSRVFSVSTFLLIFLQAMTTFNDLNESQHSMQTDIPSEVPTPGTPFAAKIHGFTELTLTINVIFLYLLLFRRRDLYKYMFNQPLIYNTFLKHLHNMHHFAYIASQRKSIAFGETLIQVSSFLSLVMPSFVPLATTYELELGRRIIYWLIDINLEPTVAYIPFLIIENVFFIT